jgi:hypothetical protein
MIFFFRPGTVTGVSVRWRCFCWTQCMRRMRRNPIHWAGRLRWMPAPWRNLSQEDATNLLNCWTTGYHRMSDLGLGCKTGLTKVDIVATVADSMKHPETRICEILRIRVRITIYPTNFLGHLRWKCWRMASDPMSFGRLLGRRGCMGHHGTAMRFVMFCPLSDQGRSPSSHVVSQAKLFQTTWCTAWQPVELVEPVEGNGLGPGYHHGTFQREGPFSLTFS